MAQVIKNWDITYSAVALHTQVQSHSHEYKNLLRRFKSHYYETSQRHYPEKWSICGGFIVNKSDKQVYEECSALQKVVYIIIL